jgi:iron complex outermembrane recepter protein
MKQYKSKSLLLSYVFLFANTLSAQQVKGIVTDELRKPQVAASVMLMRIKDTSFIKGAATDDKGTFLIESIAAGQYFIRVSAVGFSNYISSPFILDGMSVFTLPNIVLNKLNKELGEVTVTSVKPLIEVKADKLILNVDASPINNGLNALELLNKSPGVSVDQEDNIFLKGRQNVMVQINGKALQMSAQVLAQLLKSINSNDVEAIEIISNPGARYDAEGTGGLINIRLKKDKKLGTNGSASAGFYYGITPKADASFSFNNRNKKTNLFGSMSLYRGARTMKIDLDQITSDAQFNRKTTSSSFSRNNNARIGFDYTPNRKHTFGILLTGGYFTPSDEINSLTEIGNINNTQIDSLLIAETYNEMHNWNIQPNFNYKYADTLGKELKIDFDLSFFRDRSDRMNDNFYRNATNTQTLSTVSSFMAAPRDINLKSIKLDYEQPLNIFKKQKGKLGIGGKVSDVLTDNRFKFMNVVNNEFILNTDRSNDFTYREKIAAAYLNYYTPLSKKLSLQTGVRMEHTISKGNLVAYKPINNKTVERAYTNLFPSAALSYLVSEKITTTLTYRRSIDRPRYQILNPFEFQLSELDFRRGNPFIRPEYTNTIEMGFLLWQRSNFAISFAKTNGAYLDISDKEYDSATGKLRFVVQPRNLASSQNIGFSFNSLFKITKWWTGNLNMFYNFSALKADYGSDKILNLKTHGGGLRMQNVFTLSKTLTTELSGWYNSGGLRGVYTIRPQGVLDIGMTKKIFKGDGTLRLSFTDFLNIARWSDYTTLGSLYINSQGRWEARQLKMNFTYRFGNKNIQNTRRRNTGTEDERRRTAGDGAN